MSDANIRKNDVAWVKLFDKYDIINKIIKEGHYIIKASEIKPFREPRLMAKFDNSINLPDIFKRNNISILPINRGEYILSNFVNYHEFEDSMREVHTFALPEHIQSLDSNDIPSESIALNCAYASGIISDFLEDEGLFSTVSGRMGSGEFSFKIRKVGEKETFDININGAQIEIDAAYEGIESLALIEAKKYLSDDFLIRQLYYPFRLFSSKVAKKVRPIFIVYSNGIYKAYEYVFENYADYNSLKLVKQKNYSIECTDISQEDIESVFNDTTSSDEPKIPFPQADIFDRVINLCELLFEKSLSRNEVTEEYAFDVRQTNYYSDAARYLGLVIKSSKESNVLYELTDTCRGALCMKYKERQLFFCKCILSHRVFHETFKRTLANGKIPDKSEIVQIMKNSNLYGIDSESTFERRASTIRGWLNWIISVRTI